MHNATNYLTTLQRFRIVGHFQQRRNIHTLGPPDWHTIDDYKSVAAVNLYGLIDVTMTFLPLVKMARGRVVNTSSVCGKIAACRNCTPYSVSKYGVEAFTDGLRSVLHQWRRLAWCHPVAHFERRPLYMVQAITF